MEGFRIVLLAGLIAATMGGALYAGIRAERMAEESAPALESDPDRSGFEAEPGPEVEPDREVEPKPAVDPGPDTEPMLAAMAPIDSVPFEPLLDVGFRLEGDALEPVEGDIVLASGLRIGEASFGNDLFAEESVVDDARAEDPNEPAAEPTRRTRRRRAPARPPMPRLHPDPGMHSILVARRMMANGERIQGSCYKYLSKVYERAGHRSWRKRRIVYRAERDGPYADLDQVRPGDWLYIVNDPHRTPVGTHSVMFVRWTDRARGYASVISHPGWGAPHTGAERTYDISRTYRIIRPTL